MSQERSLFSREAHRRQRLARFAAVRMPASRKSFLRLIANLAEIDRESTLNDDAFGDFAVAHFLVEIEGRSGCVYTVLKAFFWFGLELPHRFRKCLSPRIDLSRALTFSDAAKIVYSALREASLPALIEAFGARAGGLTDRRDWKRRTN